jgi:hypothetical protein
MSLRDIEGNTGSPDGPAPAAVSPRGYGRAQRRIWRAFLAMPDRELTTADLVSWCYPRLVGKPGRPQWVAIRRAAEKVALRISRTHTRPGGIIWRAKADEANQGQA